MAPILPPSLLPTAIGPGQERCTQAGAGGPGLSLSDPATAAGPGRTTAAVSNVASAPESENTLAFTGTSPGPEPVGPDAAAPSTVSRVGAGPGSARNCGPENDGEDDAVVAEPAMPVSASGRYAYVTLLTREGYLPGVQALRGSLRAVSSPFPLLVLCTPDTLGARAMDTLENEGCQLVRVKRYCPATVAGIQRYKLQCYADCWNKLHMWGLEWYDRLCYLDADMLLVKNIDHLLLAAEPGKLYAVRDCFVGRGGEQPALCPMFDPGFQAASAGADNTNTPARAATPSASEPTTINTDINTDPETDVERRTPPDSGPAAPARLGARGSGPTHFQLEVELDGGEGVRACRAWDAELPEGGSAAVAGAGAARAGARDGGGGVVVERYFNAGMFVITPDKGELLRFQRVLAEGGEGVVGGFAEQDLLNKAYKGTWVELPYGYNAQKGAKVHHPELWRDGHGVFHNIHYVDAKPWDRHHPENAPFQDIVDYWWHIFDNRLSFASSNPHPSEQPLLSPPPLSRPPRPPPPPPALAPAAAGATAAAVAASDTAAEVAAATGSGVVPVYNPDTWAAKKTSRGGAVSPMAAMPVPMRGMVAAMAVGDGGGGGKHGGGGATGTAGSAGCTVM